MTRTALAMRALVLAEFGTMEVQERPIPTPSAGQALVRVIATGICGSDLHGFTGDNGRRVPGQIMGHETVGLVVDYGGEVPRGAPAVGAPVTVNPTLSCGSCAECGRGLTHLCANRRVIGVNPEISAAFAEFFVVPIRNLHELDRQMPVEHGALVEPLAVGHHAVVRGAVRAGDVVVIIGAGPIGQAALIAAFRAGAVHVLVSEPSAARRDLAARLGAEVFDPTGEDVADRALALTHGVGAHVAIDAVGSSQTIDSALHATRRGGSTVLVGMNAKTLELDAYSVSTDERRLVGAFCYSESEFAETVTWAATAAADLAQLISRRVSLDEAPEAFRSLSSGADSASKILVTFDQARVRPTSS